jgi:hypothetical protein
LTSTITGPSTSSRSKAAVVASARRSSYSRRTCWCLGCSGRSISQSERSDRDIESLTREAGLGQLSKTTVSTICRELRDRYRAFRARSLADVRLLALMLDAIYLPAEAGLRALIGDLAGDYPSAAACLADDLAALTVHLAYPLRLKRRLRSTNPLERSLEEVRRRTKVIGRFPGETSCLTLAWAVMDLVIAGGRGLGLTIAERHEIAALVASRSTPQLEERIA